MVVISFKHSTFSENLVGTGAVIILTENGAYDINNKR